MVLSAGLTCALGGCGGSQGGHRGGALATLTIYVTGPQEGPDSRQNLDVIDAERLALRQIGSRVGPFNIRLSTLDDASPATGQWSPHQTTANAERVAEDPTAIAYITDATPGAPAESLKALNRAGILQVNAGETMQDPPAGGGSVQPPPFAEFGPPEITEADADLELMRTQRVKRLLVLDDGSAYGRSIARSVAQRARSFHIELVKTAHPIRTAGPNLSTEIAAVNAQAIFFGALTSATSITTWARLAAAAPRTELLGASGLDTPQFAAAIPGAAQTRTFLDEPGLAQSDLSPAAQNFVTDFTAAYGHPPQPAAFFGYAAAQAVLDAIHQAGRRARNPAAIATMFLGLRAFPSVLGTYSIDDGTATITPSFIFSTVTKGKLRFVRIVYASD